MQLVFPEGDRNLMDFDVLITPDEGIYKDGTFKFTINVPQGFPHEPPKVHCTQKIYHPNIDLEGHVCLNILRQDWKPVLSIESALIGLQFLFLEPNPNDPLNKEAATEFVDNRAAFKNSVRKAMSGGIVHGQRFDNVLGSKASNSNQHYY